MNLQQKRITHVKACDPLGNCIETEGQAAERVITVFLLLAVTVSAFMLYTMYNRA